MHVQVTTFWLPLDVTDLAGEDMENVAVELELQARPINFGERKLEPALQVSIHQSNAIYSLGEKARRWQSFLVVMSLGNESWTTGPIQRDPTAQPQVLPSNVLPPIAPGPVPQGALKWGPEPPLPPPFPDPQTYTPCGAVGSSPTQWGTTLSRLVGCLGRFSGVRRPCAFMPVVKFRNHCKLAPTELQEWLREHAAPRLGAI